jgi:hypothetical protein
MSPQVGLTPNLAILTYAFLASMVATMACGLAPALHATELDLVPALKEEGLRCRAGWRARGRATR